MPTVRPPTRLVARFSSRLVDHDLPALPAERREAAVAFATRRVAGLPDVVATGVAVVAVAADTAVRLGGHRALAVLAGRPLPLLGDYVRLVRSLTTAFVWDSWPDTAPDGAPGR